MLNYVLNKKHDNRLPPVIILNYDATKQTFLDKGTGCLRSLCDYLHLKRQESQSSISIFIVIRQQN